MIAIINQGSFDASPNCQAPLIQFNATAPLGIIVGPLDHFQWNGVPATAAVGVDFNITVLAVDAHGNLITDYAATNSIRLAGSSDIQDDMTTGHATANGDNIPNMVEFAPPDMVFTGGVCNITVNCDHAGNLVLNMLDRNAGIVNTDSPAVAVS